MHLINLANSYVATLFDISITFRICVGRGRVVIRTSGPQLRNPGSNPLAAVSKLWQLDSPHHVATQLYK